MPRETPKYFWPSSGLTETDMALLFRARESMAKRTPITRLIALAVRQTYGHLADAAIESDHPENERMAA